MRNYFILAVVVGIAGLIVFSGCGSEATRIPEESLESLLLDEQAGAETVEETVTTEPVREQPIREPVREERVAEVEDVSFVDVNFDFDEYELTAAAREVLAEHARQLKDNLKILLLIEGHCDERGTIEYNLALGDRRADAVKTYLINYGIDPERLYSISYGKEKPLVPQQTEDAWAKNRRAAFSVVEK